jgi:hypothetical protein
MHNETRPAPKAPRWITTEAGKLAWELYDGWRVRASGALSVEERGALLAEAEELRAESVTAA